MLAERDTDSSTRPPTQHRGGSSWSFRATGAVLALEVTWVHVSDQGGPLAMRDPGYLGWGYRVLELAGIVVALWLTSGWRGTPCWLLTCCVAGVPLVGYLLTGGAALPHYRDDVSGWSEPLGLTAVTAEVVLLVLAGSALRRLKTPGDRDGGD